MSCTCLKAEEIELACHFLPRIYATPLCGTALQLAPGIST